MRLANVQSGVSVASALAAPLVRKNENMASAMLASAFRQWMVERGTSAEPMTESGSGGGRRGNAAIPAQAGGATVKAGAAWDAGRSDSAEEGGSRAPRETAGRPAQGTGSISIAARSEVGAKSRAAAIETARNSPAEVPSNRFAVPVLRPGQSGAARPSGAIAGEASCGSRKLQSVHAAAQAQATDPAAEPEDSAKAMGVAKRVETATSAAPAEPTDAAEDGLDEPAPVHKADPAQETRGEVTVQAPEKVFGNVSGDASVNVSGKAYAKGKVAGTGKQAAAVPAVGAILTQGSASAAPAAGVPKSSPAEPAKASADNAAARQNVVASRPIQAQPAAVESSGAGRPAAPVTVTAGHRYAEAPVGRTAATTAPAATGGAETKTPAAAAVSGEAAAGLRQAVPVHTLAPAPAPTCSSAAQAPPTLPGAAFDHIDSGAMPQMLSRTPQRLDVGMRDPGLGWVEIRAHAAEGQIAATVSSSFEAHPALAAQLPAMRDYLAGQQVRVDTLNAKAFEASPDGGRHAGRDPDPRRDAAGGAMAALPEFSEEAEPQSLSWIDVRV